MIIILSIYLCKLLIFSQLQTSIYYNNIYCQLCINLSISKYNNNILNCNTADR